MQINLLNCNHKQQQQQQQHRQQYHHNHQHQKQQQHHLQMNQRHQHSLVQRTTAAAAATSATTMTHQSKATAPQTTLSSASHSASSRPMTWAYMLLALFIAHQMAEAKPLNQYQVKFRRVPPKEFSAALGSSITIECEAGASPPPTIHWLKDGKRIIQNELDENKLDDEATGQTVQVDDVSRIALSSSRSRLYIDCADFVDEATYTCVAENAYSRIASQTKLNLIKPVAQLASNGNSNENDLVSDEALDGGAGKQGGGAVAGANSSPLSAVPQCLSDRLRMGVSPSAPARIHMWTHNIVEIMKNNVVLLCRSNIKRPAAQQQDSLEMMSGKQQGEMTPTSAQANSKPMVSWTLPNDKQVSEDQKDKYQLLDTGDLLIKDLSWADMGSYVCTVSDEQSSDSVSSFVYPAAVKATNNKRAVSATSGGRFSRFS